MELDADRARGARKGRQERYAQSTARRPAAHGRGAVSAEAKPGAFNCRCCIVSYGAVPRMRAPRTLEGVTHVKPPLRRVGSPGSD